LFSSSFGRHACSVARFVDDDGRVQDHARRGITLVESGRIHERFESGSRLAARLRHAVVLALEIVESAHQRHHRAVAGIDGNQGALRFGNLYEHQRIGAAPTV